MRFMSMHKTNKSTEAGAPPSPELMAGMGPLIGDLVRAGIFVSAEGLQPSSKGVRLNFSGSKRTITKGPFVGSNELISGYCIVKVTSIEEAIDWASRFAGIVGDAEIDIRPLTEPWDLGLFPKPAGETRTRFMIARKADRASESGVRPRSEVSAAMNKLIGDMTEAGVFLAAEGLQPSAKGLRLNFSNGKRTVTDGPFTESKELIGGFSILRVKSRDEAVEWASRFAGLMGDVEIDIRLLDEEP